MSRAFDEMIDASIAGDDAAYAAARARFWAIKEGR